MDDATDETKPGHDGHFPPKLGFHNKRTNHFDALRPLTPEELAAHEGFLGPVTESRNRLILFRLLAANFREWRKYLNSLLNVEFADRGGAMDELNRLLLNYLTTAYTIHEHFKVSFMRRFRGDKAKIAEHEDFVAKLCDKFWEFGFVLDYRGYVQHRGLAVGRFTRTPSETSVSISVTTDAAALAGKGREKDWKLSKLTPDKGLIDLVSAIRCFHVVTAEQYGLYVAKVFFPELVKADEFYMGLTKEAKAKDPEATMVFFTKEIERTPMEDGTVEFNISYSQPPNDVFAELGLLVDRSDQGKKGKKDSASKRPRRARQS